MQLYPAIDIKNGQCVRLTQGLFDNVKVYSNSPADMALRWQDKKASYLHLVDLDGALAGRSVNEEVIKEIVRAVDIPVQLGGGIRSAETVERMLLNGIARVIIGTKAVERPEFMRELVERFGPERIVAGVDAKNGQVAIEGWGKLSDISALTDTLYTKCTALEKSIADVPDASPEDIAHYYHDVVIPAMEAVREPADKLESKVGKTYWPFPTYSDILFYV